MITVGNRSFEERICIRERQNFDNFNRAIDGSLYGYRLGSNHIWNITLEKVNQEEKRYLEVIESFDFTDDENFYCKGRIRKMSIKEKYKLGEKNFYSIDLQIEEVIL